jgi:hypothetical protein
VLSPRARHEGVVHGGADLPGIEVLGEQDAFGREPQIEVRRHNRR